MTGPPEPFNEHEIGTLLNLVRRDRRKAQKQAQRNREVGLVEHLSGQDADEVRTRHLVGMERKLGAWLESMEEARMPATPLTFLLPPTPIP